MQPAQSSLSKHEGVELNLHTRVEDAYGDAKGLSGLHLLQGPDSAPCTLALAYS